METVSIQTSNFQILLIWIQENGFYKFIFNIIIYNFLITCTLYGSILFARKLHNLKNKMLLC